MPLLSNLFLSPVFLERNWLFSVLARSPWRQSKIRLNIWRDNEDKQHHYTRFKFNFFQARRERARALVAAAAWPGSAFETSYPVFPKDYSEYELRTRWLSSCDLNASQPSVASTGGIHGNFKAMRSCLVEGAFSTPARALNSVADTPAGLP
jgi:hypothetical protein